MDSRLQQLSRQVAEGDSQAQVALLTERLRCGELTREQIELAAWCSDEAARAVVWARRAKKSPIYEPWGTCERNCHWVGGVHEPGCKYYEFLDWLKGLQRFGKMTMVRASVAAARKALFVWEKTNCWCDQLVRTERLIGPAVGPEGCVGVSSPRLAIEAAEAWVLCPCEEHRKASVRPGRMASVHYPWACAAQRALVEPPQTNSLLQEVYSLSAVINPTRRVLRNPNLAHLYWHCTRSVLRLVVIDHQPVFAWHFYSFSVAV